MIEKIDSYPTWVYKRETDRWSTCLYTFALLVGERKATPKEMSQGFKPELRKVYTVSKIARLYRDNMQVRKSSPSDPIGKEIYGYMLSDWILLKKMTSTTKRNIFQTVFNL